MARSLARDRRGLAISLVAFIAALVLAALLFIVMDAALADVFAVSNEQADHAGASTFISDIEAVWDRILLAVLFVCMLFIIGRAVIESEVR